jgi:hypothetical protein
VGQVSGRDGQGLAADRRLTVNQETLNTAIPSWAIDSLLFGMPKYTSATKIWGRIVSVAMAAQERGWTPNEFVNEVTKTERRKNDIGQKRLLLLRPADSVAELPKSY